MTMHTLVEKPKAGSQALRAKSPTPVSERFGRNRGLASAASSPFGYDLSRIPIRPGAMGALQAKLAINEPGDRYEQEADRVSEQVMRMDAPDIARTAPPAIQRLGTGAQETFAGGGHAQPQVEAKVEAVGGGQRLTKQQRSFFEPRFGADFSQVRIHADSGADAAARAVGALAYTRGSDIVFRSDQYRPDTPAGGPLLAHELTHVVQQGAATSRRQDGLVKEDAAGRIQRRAPPQGDTSIRQQASIDSPKGKDTPLSAHFTLEEFIRSDSAATLGNDNMPTPEHLENLKKTAAGFEQVLAILGGSIKITSGYRNPVVNKSVGGTPTSAHPQGFAGDFSHASLSPLDCARKLRDSDLQFDQLILETSRNIVHIGFGPGSRRMVGEQKGGPGTTIVWKLP
jgi:zinc D-Ala-D-Ala carboxypeptidase